ncbi:hypothetical protein ADL15_32925 [Actinoplanes awajinensis subsp. mycoplanecinus]|uniref:Uncharacterized protein n=2 Tax=Actinoplanes awajinensis TaxID=135946 RepID=A0A101JJG1_9ACTN|nr:hypothetical protein ADL15_32925 [Actinoplanes awajinensis subsp. mycoplanecinus]
MGVMDNEISTAVEDGDPENIVPVANRVRKAAAASAYETETRQLPHDRLTSAELPATDWRYAVLALADWADIGDGMTPGVDPDGSQERELMAAITTQLPDGTMDAD